MRWAGFSPGAWDHPFAEPWLSWWGDDSPYHHPVFVLTHHPRPPVPMQGGTTFHFLDSGIEPALEQAFAAADTVKQYRRAGVNDELHLAIIPIVLGGGAGSSTSSAASPIATRWSIPSAPRRSTCGSPSGRPDTSS